MLGTQYFVNNHSQNAMHCDIHSAWHWRHQNLQRIKLVSYNIGRIFNPVSSQNFTKILCTVDNFPRFAIIKWVVLIWKLRLRRCDLVNLHLKWSPLSQQVQNISFLPLDNTFNNVNLHDWMKHKTPKTLELQPSNVHLLKLTVKFTKGNSQIATRSK